MNVNDIEPTAHRQTTPDAEVAPLFPDRWSPRAMSGASLSEADLLPLLEAARWAPSCFNAQPWRLAYVLNGAGNWQPVYESLVEGNQAWASQAGALIAFASRREYEHNGEAAPTHSFDAGAAWMSLALQARMLGLVAHGMRGFDLAAARAAFKVPEIYELNAIIAVGHPGNIESLPEKYRDREIPSPRKPLAEIAFAQDFGALPE